MVEFTCEIGGEMAVAYAGNNNNEKQGDEMAVANAVDINDEEEDEDVYGNELKLVETVNRDGVQLNIEGNGVQPTASIISVQSSPASNIKSKQ